MKFEFISVVSYLTPGVVPETTRCCCQFSEANILTGDFRRGGFGLPKKIHVKLFNKRECRYKAETPPHHAFFTWIGTLQQWIFHKWDLTTSSRGN